jgi:NitT/TauT family transport system substrate-binding protein
VPYTAFSASFTALWVAADENLFAKRSVDASVQYMDSNVAAAALLSGEIDICSTPQMIGGILSGGDATFIAKLVSSPVFSLYASKDIQRVEDLKGKVIGDTLPGTAPDNALRDILSKHGLKDTDVKFAHSPNPTTAFATMQAGQAAAAILSAPVTLQARKGGFKELADAGKEGVVGLAAALSVKKSRLKDNPAALRAFLQALQDTYAFMKANPARTKEIIGKYTKTESAADLDETYTAFVPYWQLGAITPADVSAMLRYSTDPKAGSVSPSSFFDNSLIDALQ